MQISIEGSGIREIDRYLEHVSATLSDLSPIHRHIGNIIQNAIEESFENEASPSGKSWKPSLKKEGKTLTDSGTLSSSFTVDASSSEVSVGTNLVYAAIHQWGGKAGRNRSSNIPARPFLPITDSRDLEGRVKSEILEYLSGKIGA